VDFELPCTYLYNAVLLLLIVDGTYTPVKNTGAKVVTLGRARRRWIETVDAFCFLSAEHRPISWFPINFLFFFLFSPSRPFTWKRSRKIFKKIFLRNAVHNDERYYEVRWAHKIAASRTRWISEWFFQLFFFQSKWLTIFFSLPLVLLIKIINLSLSLSLST
jgi:hypothetical protein